ncbi:MAG: cytochrome c biogenesis protein CcsA [Phycisphaerae bacterium]|nr:cytochrome c biogenesis protein CcsA [Phycisphaerae bacterium]
MTGPVLVLILAGLCFATAAAVGYLEVRRHKRGMGPYLLSATLFGVAVNGGYVVWALLDHGPVGTFRQNHEAAMLLATLVAMAAVGTHFSRALRGLDGVLLLLATVVNLLALAAVGEPASPVTYKSWFVSHSVAFAVSGACFVIGGAAGMAYLLVHRVLHRKRALDLMGRVASLESLDRFGRWMMALGFPLFTYGILTGMCGVAHREDLRRTAWYLDGSVLVSALVWLVYACLLGSLTFRPQVRGRQAALLATCGMWLTVIVFLLREFGSPIHQ